MPCLIRGHLASLVAASVPSHSLLAAAGRVLASAAEVCSLWAFDQNPLPGQAASPASSCIRHPECPELLAHWGAGRGVLPSRLASDCESSRVAPGAVLRCAVQEKLVSVCMKPPASYADERVVVVDEVAGRPAAD